MTSKTNPSKQHPCSPSTPRAAIKISAKLQHRLKVINQHVHNAYNKNSRAYKHYPQAILDVIIFHKFHFFFAGAEAVRHFRQLKSNFVDWNEIRISSIRDIQEVIGFSPSSLEMAIFIKGLLEQVNRYRHTLDLEFLVEKNSQEIRGFLKKLNSLDAATIQLVLRLRKGLPVLPVTPSMESSLVRLGLVKARDPRDQKGRYLHQLIDAASALPFHHFFLNHSREVCPPDEAQVQCKSCVLRAACDFFHKSYKRMQAPQKSAAAKKTS